MVIGLAEAGEVGVITAILFSRLVANSVLHWGNTAHCAIYGVGSDIKVVLSKCQSVTLI